MENLFFLIKRGIIILFLLNALNVSAQLTINPGANALLLAGSIQGTGVTITNPTKTSPNAHTATFDNGNSTNIGINKGIILSTGVAASINGAASFSANSNGSGAGYSLLEPLANATTYDAAILEFDVVPSYNYLQINFVFGAEEYPDYVGTDYNDAFGFFISGTNPDGGTYSNQNFALIPGTNTPISVNTVNDGYLNAGPCQNCDYYINNSSGASIKYNGFTKPMSSKIKVSPGSSYHVIVAIADGGDGNQDAAILIEFGGLSSSTPLPVNFVSFTGEKTNTGNLIQWSTNIETNSDHYSVERSIDGITFEDIAEIASLNKNKCTTNYEFLDKQSLNLSIYPYLYYRIKQIDISGNATYTNEIITIKNTPKKDFILFNSIISDGILNIKLECENDNQAEIFLMDTSGKIFFDEQISFHAGLNETNFNLGAIQSGIVLLKIVKANEIINYKLLKQ